MVGTQKKWRSIITGKTNLRGRIYKTSGIHGLVGDIRG